jgi:protein associated with RNAse G/E
MVNLTEIIFEFDVKIEINRSYSILEVNNFRENQN